MKTIENQIAYFPDSRINKSKLIQLGDHSQFSGTPCPTKETVALIGEQGVEYVDQLMKQVGHFRALIFGKESIDSSFIFPSINRVLHYPSRNFLEIIDPYHVMEHDLNNIDHHERKEKGLFWKHLMQKNRAWFSEPELMDSDNFYFMMLNQSSKVSMKKKEILELIENTQKIMSFIQNKS